jgi:cytochrome c biogenesis protein CcdA
LWYNFIFVLPLLITLFTASNAGLLEKVNVWRKENTGEMKLFGGIAMVGLGLLILLLSR